MSDKEFFRLNVDKLLTKLPNPVTFNESQQAMIKGLNENRFFVHIAARRTGKSYAAAILAFAKLLEPGQQVMVVAPNFSLSSIIWDYVTDLIKNCKEVIKLNQIIIIDSNKNDIYAFTLKSQKLYLNIMNDEIFRLKKHK